MSYHYWLSSLSFILLLLSQCFAQDGDLPVADSASRQNRPHTLYISYRTPELGEVIEPTTGENLFAEHSSLVLGYSFALTNHNLVSAEFGWSKTRAFPLYQSNGGVSQYTRAFIPELRLGYRYLFNQPARHVRPYLGIGTVLFTPLTPVAGQRIAGGFMEVQTMAGLRIFPEGGPVSIQVEVPFTFITMGRTPFADGGGRTSGRFSHPQTLENFVGQFWPFLSIGWRW